MTTEDDEPDAREPSYTSLGTLRAHQKELRRELMDGFKDRNELLLWQHDVAAKTIGQVPDSWHTKFVTDRWLTAAMMRDAATRAEMTSHPPDDENAYRRRQDIIQEDLMPASQRAVVSFRQNAVEYVDDPDEPVDMGRQQFIAMRPRLDEVVADQREALEWALDVHDWREPIDGREAALEWADEIIYATYGRIGEDFTFRVSSRASDWLPALKAPESLALKALLADEVLPAMNANIRYVVERAQEVNKEVREGPTVDPRPTEAY